jgi:hypothetical protein
MFHYYIVNFGTTDSGYGDRGCWRTREGGVQSRMGWSCWEGYTRRKMRSLDFVWDDTKCEEVQEDGLCGC